MLLSEQEIKDRLSAVRLPSMPQILIKLMEQCQNEEAGISDLAKLVSKDAGMTGKILGVAHSSAYHRGGQKVGLEQSLMSLGIDMIKTLVISESVFQTFNNFSASKNIDLRSFWKHSLAAAIIARQTAKKIGYPNIDEAYLAGLLHDIGRLALLAIAPKEYAFHFQFPDDDSLCAAEQRMLQMTHSEAGSFLIGHWRLDSFMADSVLYHHEPANRIEDAHPLIRIVYLSHLLASEEHIEQSSIVSALSYCGIEADDLPLITDGLAEKVDHAAEFLGIDLSGLDAAPKPAPVSSPAPAQELLNAEIQNMMQSSELGRFFSSLQGKGEAEMRETTCRSARIFFKLDSTFLMQHDAGENILIGYPPDESMQRLAGFSISLKKGGAIAESVLKRTVRFLSPHDGSAGIAAEQLSRILGSECLVCIPLASSEHCAGIVVGGAASWQIKDLQKNERLLKAFGAQAATALINAKKVSAVSKTQQDSATALKEQYRDASRRVAHEVNNPLSIIKNYLRVLDNKLSKREPVSSELSILNEELDRVSQIINGFAEQPSLNQDEASNKVTDINQIIDDVVRLFRDTEFAPRTVRITADLQNSECKVSSSPAVLKQIMVNLVKNAVEAMPNGGAISIKNNGVTRKEERTFVQLSVSDTGPGIPKHILDNLFQSVRSTKGSGHQGLGLSIVHNLVNTIQGQIMCHSDTRGTTFELLIPAPSPSEPINEKKYQVQHSA